MASNRLPGQLDRLFARAEDMADGLAAHETAVGIKQNKEADVRADLAAAAAAEADFQPKRRAKTVAATAASASAPNSTSFPMAETASRCTSFEGTRSRATNSGSFAGSPLRPNSSARRTAAWWSFGSRGLFMARL